MIQNIARLSRLNILMSELSKLSDRRKQICVRLSMRGYEFRGAWWAIVLPTSSFKSSQAKFFFGACLPRRLKASK